MLVLTRKPGEIIRIGDDVAITVLEVRGDHVRIGITAPRSVPVHREEVWVEIHAENRSSAGTADTTAEAARNVRGLLGR